MAAIAPDNIFINYRREDEPGFAGRLYDKLGQCLPDRHVFIDVHDIPAGTDFELHVKEQIQSCNVMLVLIGSNWLNCRNGAGVERLHLDSDYVRIEIELAIRLGKRVIPVLLNKAEMPTGDQLPESIELLAKRNAVRLTHERWREDSDSLIRALQLPPLDDEAAGGHIESNADSATPASLIRASPLAAAPAQLLPSSVAVHAASFTGAVHNYLAYQSSAKLWGLSVCGGAALLYLSNIVEIDSVLLSEYHSSRASSCHYGKQGDGKQVGMWYAPNWSIVYLLLFPLYLVLFTRLSQLLDRCVSAFSGANLATPHKRLTVNAIVEKEFASSSGLLKTILLASFSIAVVGWWFSAGSGLWKFERGKEIIDWSNVVVACHLTDLWVPALVFTFIAYVWMGFALFVYLSLLFIGFIYATIVFKLSETLLTESRCARAISGCMTEFMYVYFAGCCLGLLAAYCMGIQVAYLKSSYTHIVPFATKDFWGLIGQAVTLSGESELSKMFQPEGAKNPTYLTSILVLGITFLALIGTSNLVLQTLNIAARAGNEPGASEPAPDPVSTLQVGKLAILPLAIGVATVSGFYSVPIVVALGVLCIWAVAQSVYERRPQSG